MCFALCGMMISQNDLFGDDRVISYDVKSAIEPLMTSVPIPLGSLVDTINCLIIIAIFAAADFAFAP